MKWVVLVTFLFAGHMAQTEQRLCPDFACVTEAWQLFERDPNALRFRYWSPEPDHGGGELYVDYSGMTTTSRPVADVWKE